MEAKVLSPAASEDQLREARGRLLVNVEGRYIVRAGRRASWARPH
jgi:hypothetical protein